MSKTCLKCGHSAEVEAADPTAQCPSCGVYYHKFEAQAERLAAEAGLSVAEYLEKAKQEAEELRRQSREKAERQLEDEAAKAGLSVAAYVEKVKRDEEELRRQKRQKAERQRVEQADRIENAKRSGDWSGISKDEVAGIFQGVVLTTTHTIPGYEIKAIKDVVSAECAYGMNILFDLFADIRDFVGGRSQNVQKVLRAARANVMVELKKEAMMVGGNAVIGVDLDYSEFSGKDKSMLFVVATGTAVEAEKVE
ncbi:heavy metal-binding domain-containing protein [Pseudomonas sp. FME51]|uniref:heavy metal-binding domain-containing protein n=1 Tax=Pseudomonas sp. FME51 TaxID=2742609 RepID=UPI00299F8B9D|nr:heavy metal-binding domain-containing protein [Pseudomonas sp. FME51]